MYISIFILTVVGIMLGIFLYMLQTKLNELESESDTDSNFLTVVYILSVPLFLVINYLLYDFSGTFYVASLFSTVILTEAISDIKYGIVLDSLIIFGLLIIVPYRIVEGTIFIYLIGALIIFTMLYLIALYFYKRTGEISLGGGDIKLYFLIGFLLNPISLFVSLNIASMVALIYGLIRKILSNKIEIRLVPFIFCGTMLTFYLESVIIDLIN